MKKYLLTSALVSVLATMAYNNQAGWKLDADGKIEMKDGNPVWLDTSGRESVVQGDTITRLNGEARSHREGKEAAELKLKAFDGLDAELARKALDTVKNIDAKKLIDSGEVEKVKDEIRKELTGQLTEKDGRINDLQSRMDGMMIDGVFGSSAFVAERVAVPRDMFQDSFRKNFKVKDGKIEAYGKDGNRLMSKKNVGEYADAEEALELLVDSHSQKDTILKAVDQSGSGNQGGGGGRGAGAVVKRAEFDTYTPAKKQEIAGKVAKGEMKIVD